MRIKRGTTSKRKHNKIFTANKGYRMTKRRLISVATEAYLHAGEYAYAGRKLRKRDIRRLWITRVSEALKMRGFSYNAFIHKMKEANIELDRKVLANLVVEDPDVFDAILDEVKSVN